MYSIADSKVRSWHRLLSAYVTESAKGAARGLYNSEAGVEQ